jgi:ankyrin repeat protein
MRRTLAVIMTLTLVFLTSCKSNPEKKLHSAAFLGRIDQMKTLIEQGMDVNKVVDGEAPIHSAVRGGHVDAVALLMEKGADVQAKDDKGRDVWERVHHSERAFIGDRDAQMMAFLLQNGFEGRLTLTEAAAKGNSALLIKTLVDQGADVNETDEFGWTPLHHAAFEARGESCLGLLQADAEVNAESTREFSKMRRTGGDGQTYDYRYEAGSRPLDVCAYGSSRTEKSANSVLKEWGGTKNPEVDNLRRAHR